MADGLIWAPNRDSGTVSVIDPETRTVTDTITAGDGPSAPGVADGLIWVPNKDSDTVSIIDPAATVPGDSAIVDATARGLGESAPASVSTTTTTTGRY